MRGARHVIFHLYNSTSPAQRRYVFGLEKPAIVQIATRAVAQLKREGQALIAAGTRLQLEYSPESFTSTELEFSLEICEAVSDLWQPTAADPIILNLPATVEYATPNVHADQIEWMCTHLRRRDATLVSLHTHNDRGTGVAATELSLLAGADRVEGTLFGNGERTGNVDIVTLALNLYTTGVHPGLDFGDINAIREVYERCTRLEVPARQPYAGELVFTAFSGSHQDAIKKSWAQQAPDRPWDVLYIPIDPADIGRSYKAIIRINSQSGKGGVAYVLEHEFGFHAAQADAQGDRPHDQRPRRREGHRALRRPRSARPSSANTSSARRPVGLRRFKAAEQGGAVRCEVELAIDGEVRQLAGSGNGPIDAFVHALLAAGLPKFDVLSYAEHSLGSGAEARAVSYIQIKTERGHSLFGAGIDTNIELASIKAIVSAVNRVARPAMKFAPAKPALTGETLDTLAARLAARGEPAFRAGQILEWLYKRRARSWDEMTNLPKAPAGLAGGDVRPHAGRAGPQPPVGRRDRQAAARTRGRQSLIETVIIRAPAGGRRARPLPQDDLHLHPGRLRHGVRLLRQRPGRLEARPHRRRDRGPAAAGLPRRGRAHPAGPRRAGLVRQHRRHGHGRAARQLRRPDARPDDPQRRVGPGLRRAPDHRSPPAASCPKILRLAAEPLGFRLAISLHGATDEVRARIMPVNRAYPLAKLLPAVRAFSDRHGRMVTLEFILIAEVNDTPRAGAQAAGHRAGPPRPREPDPVQHGRRPAVAPAGRSEARRPSPTSCGAPGYP